VVLDLLDYWRDNPPVHILVKAALFQPKEKAGEFVEPEDGEGYSIEQLKEGMRAFQQG